MNHETPYTCEQARDRFSAHLDGGLPPEEGVILEAHLKGCAGCRARCEELAALDRDFNLLVAQAEYGAEERAAQILSNARAEERPSDSRLLRVSSTARLRRTAPPARRGVHPLAVAAAVLVGIALLVSLFSAGASRPDRPVPPAPDLSRKPVEERQENERENARKVAYDKQKRFEQELVHKQELLDEIARQERELAEVMRLSTEQATKAKLEQARRDAEEVRRREAAEYLRLVEEELKAREALANEMEEARKSREKAEEAARASLSPKAAPSRLPVVPVKVDAPWKLDPVAVDLSIGKGVDFLKYKSASFMGHKSLERDGRTVELALWTLVHAGVDEGDPEFQAMFRAMMDAPLERTYNVALRAMILEELDRVRHQGRIAQCAQFLLDNQALNGQWGYGAPSLFADQMSVASGPKDAATGGARKPREFATEPRGGAKPKVVRTVAVRRMREGPPAGDNSNSMYAALGLRACHDAGLLLPKESVRLAQKWWRESVHEDKDAAAGWCYGGREHGHPPYGSMTAGGVGSLVICDYILGENWKADRVVLKGLAWLARNFAVDENPGPAEHAGGRPDWMIYYYLYAMERAGALFGAEKFGVHEWYPRGVRAILESQQPDGSWSSRTSGNPVQDTCFAVLFLRRATRPLTDVETGDRSKK
jgi:hypothetical protein